MDYFWIGNGESLIKFELFLSLTKRTMNIARIPHHPVWSSDMPAL